MTQNQSQDAWHHEPSAALRNSSPNSVYHHSHTLKSTRKTICLQHRVLIRYRVHRWYNSSDKCLVCRHDMQVRNDSHAASDSSSMFVIIGTNHRFMCLNCMQPHVKHKTCTTKERYAQIEACSKKCKTTLKFRPAQKLQRISIHITCNRLLI